MKKVICLLLLLACTLGLFACGQTPPALEPTDGDGDSVNLTGRADGVGGVSFTDEQRETFDNFLSDVKANSPTRVVTLTEYITTSATYTGSYESLYDGTKIHFHYQYQTPALVEDEIELPDTDASLTITKEGDIYYKNGRLSTDGETWAAGTPPTAQPLSFELDLSCFDEAAVTGKNNIYTLKAKVSGENVARVFGTSVTANGAVSITIEVRNGYLYNSTVSYTSVQGATVSVSSSYTYNPVELDF